MVFDSLTKWAGLSRYLSQKTLKSFIYKDKALGHLQVMQFPFCTFTRFAFVLCYKIIIFARNDTEMILFIFQGIILISELNTKELCE